MDNAVAIVQAYLRMNGYFTVAEYPVVEVGPDGTHRVATDLDILAFRLPGSGRLVPKHGGTDLVIAEPDPALGVVLDEADLIIGEVKTGEAAINRALAKPEILRAALTRFGGFEEDEVDDVSAELLRTGEATSARVGRVRVVAFGSSKPYHPARTYTVVLLNHILGFLERYIDDHWDILHAAEFSEPAFGFLMTLAKARRGG